MVTTRADAELILRREIDGNADEGQVLHTALARSGL